VVVVTMTVALFRAWRNRRYEQIRWHSDFEELPDRSCRYQVSGKLRKRTCPNGFDCRVCQVYPKLAEPAEGGLAYHRGHTWVREEADGTCTVGLDEIGSRLVGTPDCVDLPAPGTHLSVNGTGWRMKRREADIRVLSPVEGEVVATGGPEEGWFLKVRAAGDLRHLLRGKEARAWMTRELERLQLLLAGNAGPALADGGVPVGDIAAAYPEADWNRVCGRMFLEP